jgi:hypothetical protein
MQHRVRSILSIVGVFCFLCQSRHHDGASGPFPRLNIIVCLPTVIPRMSQTGGRVSRVPEWLQQKRWQSSLLENWCSS